METVNFFTNIQKEWAKAKWSKRYEIVDSLMSISENTPSSENILPLDGIEGWRYLAIKWYNRKKDLYNIAVMLETREGRRKKALARINGCILPKDFSKKQLLKYIKSNKWCDLSTYKSCNEWNEYTFQLSPLKYIAENPFILDKEVISHIYTFSKYHTMYKLLLASIFTYNDISSLTDAFIEKVYIDKLSIGVPFKTHFNTADSVKLLNNMYTHLSTDLYIDLCSKFDVSVLNEALSNKDVTLNLLLDRKSLYELSYNFHKYFKDVYAFAIYIENRTLRRTKN